MVLDTGSGRVSLERSRGGIQAGCRDRTGAERSWVLLGAFRGESGVLSEGITQALLHDGLYRPALAAASTLAPAG